MNFCTWKACAAFYIFPHSIWEYAVLSIWHELLNVLNVIIKCCQVVGERLCGFGLFFLFSVQFFFTLGFSCDYIFHYRCKIIGNRWMKMNKLMMCKSQTFLVRVQPWSVNDHLYCKQKNGPVWWDLYGQISSKKSNNLANQAYEVQNSFFRGVSRFKHAWQNKYYYRREWYLNLE